MAGKIFISYRRDDAKWEARTIHKAFCQVLPHEHVFIDIDTIPPGSNFRKILKDWVDECDVLLALIGPGWINAIDPKTNVRRLDNPNDFVRIEIGEALARDIPVVPVLIDGTPMPDVDLLPNGLKELIDRMAEFVEYRTFDADVERLIKKLRLTQQPVQRMPAQPAVATPRHASVKDRMRAESRIKIDANAEEERHRRQQAEQEVFRRNAEAEALRRAEDERRRQEEAEAKRRADQEEHQRQAAEAQRARDDRRQQESNARPLEYVRGASAVAEQADITGAAHQKPEPSKDWQPSWRALAIGGAVGVIFLGAVGVWLATRRLEPVPPNVTTAQPPTASAPLVATPVQPSPALITPTTSLIQPTSGGIGPLSLERERALKPKDSFKECDNCPEMVVVPAGSFTMGSPPNEPRRGSDEAQVRATIARPFAVGKFAVTFAEWDACVADGGCHLYGPDDQGWGRDKRPVINVNWDDAKRYIDWLNAKTGKTYRLLSEAEREYVTRAGTTTPFWWGAAITPQQANYNGSAEPYTGGGAKGEYRHQTVPVDSFAANPWGLFNVHGNVWEWAEDCWNASNQGNPADGSARTTGACGPRVLRGGSWNDGPQLLRSASRGRNFTGGRGYDYGFRVGRTLTP
jgi:formylglycine-generating enzyme required for sulfatase activity